MNEVDTGQLIERVDHLIRELQAIRQQLALIKARQEAGSGARPSLTDQLFGAMGHGDWSEYEHSC